jgi:hypothetical protein
VKNILKMVPVVAALWLAPTVLAADGIQIVQKTTTGGTTRTNQIQIEKSRMRAEAAGPEGGKRVFVFDGRAQVMCIINYEKKSYLEMTKADVDRIGAQASDAMVRMQEQLKNMPPEQRARIEAMMQGRGMPGSPAAAAKIEYRKTGTATVGKWTCERYDAYLNNQKTAEICTVDPAVLGFGAADFEVTKELAAFYEKLVPQGAGQMFSIGGANEGFKGVPVRRVSFVGSQQTVTEITDVSHQTFADSTYDVPSGFEKQAQPTGARGR